MHTKANVDLVQELKTFPLQSIKGKQLSKICSVVTKKRIDRKAFRARIHVGEIVLKRETRSWTSASQQNVNIAAYADGSLFDPTWC